MIFRTSAARTNGTKTSTLSRKKLRNRTILLDQLESRVLLSVSNNGYAFDTLVSFGAGAHGPTDGSIVRDSNGDIFGTTSASGPNDGSVYEIPASGPNAGTIQTLVSFNGTDGNSPAGLTIDGAGNLYGYTFTGGANGTGTVFEVPESNRATIAVLGSFGAAVGFGSPVIVDGSGDVFGTTTTGGANGTGSVWEISSGSSNLNNVGAAASPTLLASFPAAIATDGSSPDPYAGLTLSGSTLFGVCDNGGAHGHGTIFSVSDAGGAITNVANFTASGTYRSPLLIDGSGNMFGVSDSGGASSDGFLYELPNSTTTVNTLASFSGANGETPFGQLYEDGSGDLFGTCSASTGAETGGTVFEAVPNGSGGTDTIETLAFFSAGNPGSGIIADGNGDLFGTTPSGGTNSTGSVFELTPVHLVISGVPSLFSDSPNTITPTVTLEGPTGTTITNDDSLVTLAINNSGALSFTTATSSSGVATFTDLAVTTPGPSFVLTATDANSDVPGLSSAFTVAPQPAETSTHLAFLTQPITNTGSIPTVTIGIENSSGAVVTTDDSIVTLTKASGPGTLGGTLVGQAHNGVISFTNLTLNEAGTYTLTASDDSLTSATSTSFNVRAVPTSLSITSGPTQPLTAGVPSAANVVVHLLDQFGNDLDKSDLGVQLFATDGKGKTINLGTAVLNNDGVATFRNVTLKVAGGFLLVASSKGLANGSRDITVNPAAADSMIFLQGPPDTTAGAAFSVSVELLDQFGNVATGDSSTVTLSLHKSAGTLGGTLTQAVSDGVATFGGLSVSKAGRYDIVATDNTSHKFVKSGDFIVA
jgi:uncharacterized repeat protein (TIGR03803 family)